MITDLPIVGYYDVQRFKQYNPSDTANWYMVPSKIGKKKIAAYPVMGRKHVNYLGVNQLLFDNESRLVDKSVNYWYNVVDDKIFRIDASFNEVEITQGKLNSLAGPIWMTYLIAGDITFACWADGKNVYVYREDTGSFDIVTDPNLPANPIYIATFGNRIVVSSLNTNNFGLSEINLEGSAFNPNTCFTISGAAIFAQEAGIIKQLGVFQNTLYIFCDYSIGVWNNIPSTFLSAGGVQTSFPWKKNTTYDFNFGIANPDTLDIDFGYMAWVAQNRNGLLQIMVTTGDIPKPISDKGIDVLLQGISNAQALDPAILGLTDGFLYDYENTIFYRLSGGAYTNTQLLDQISTSNSIEFNFDTQTWHRCIEKNGERNRIKQHVYFGNRHLVSIVGESTIYQMGGQFYTNDIRNPDQPDEQMVDSYIPEPFRYERVTPVICAGNIETFKSGGYYDEFITDFVEIDFIWGQGTFINTTTPYDNAVYIIDEKPDNDGNPIFMVSETDPNTYIIAEQGNQPDINAQYYYAWFKPHIELLWSDDGGISFHSADVREFSQLGVYQWRMRWYQLGPSRNRVYKLVCVSPAPIVVLGAQMDVRRVSGGAA